MNWQVKSQDAKGTVAVASPHWWGSKSRAMGEAKELARANPNTTFFVEGDNGRVPAVYHFVKVN